MRLRTIGSAQVSGLYIGGGEGEVVEALSLWSKRSEVPRWRILPRGCFDIEFQEC